MNTINTDTIQTIDCWSVLSNTPDLYKRNCTANQSYYGVPNTYSTPITDTWNNGLNNNNTMLGMWACGGAWRESMQTLLNGNIVPNAQYQLSFKAKVLNKFFPSSTANVNNLPTNIIIGGSQGLLTPLSLNTVIPSTINVLGNVTVPNNDGWNTMYINLNTTLSGINNLSLINGFNISNPYDGKLTYVMIDDVSLILLNGGSFTLPANLCSATQNLPDLNTYLNGIPTGGVFAGPSVSQTGPTSYSLNDLFDMTLGIATISYTYTNSSGCSVTVYSNINVVAPIVPAITGSTTAYPTSPNNTTTNSTIIPAGYTASWSITGGTGVFTTATNLATVGVTWSALPGYLTLTLTNTASGCTSTTSITIYNLVACDCLNSLTVTATSLGYKTFSFQVQNTNSSCTGIASGGGSRLRWDYGDGAFGTSNTHTYAVAGTYTATFIYSILGGYDQGICSGTASTTFVLGNCKTCRQANLNDITIYPNPASSLLNFDVSFKSASPFEVVIRTVDGKEILRNQWKMAKGKHELQLELPNNISDGMIFVELISDEIKETRTVLIKK